jgi:simple sugar transport system permease protein
VTKTKATSKAEASKRKAAKPAKATPAASAEDAGHILIQELMATPAEPAGPKRSWWRRAGRVALVPALAVLSGLILGGVLIALTSQEVWQAFQVSVFQGIATAFVVVFRAYAALLTGAFGNPIRMVAALQAGDPLEIRRAFNPILESMVAATPYIFAGLSVALGFRGGLFNIGAEGQIFVGAITATFVGYALTGLPMIIHLPLAILAGALGGGLWGFIPGWLKARTGAHEVINTIMMNYIAFRLSDWLLTGPMKRPDSFNPVSPTVQLSAQLPRFFAEPIRFHLGFFVALGVAYLVYWFLFRTTWGFNLRTAGSNPNAARYAGINTGRWIILTMSLAGALAGLAGTNEVLGVNHNLAMAFSSGYGFDSIALALLGRSHPLGVVLAALLFGTLRSGATRMEVVSGIPIDIISVIQAMILAFMAAPAIIRTIYRLRQPAEGEGEILVRGWGG